MVAADRSSRAASGPMPDVGAEQLDAEAVRVRSAVRLPVPGGGETLLRWRELAALGRTDLCLAKVVEPHHDARAICSDLGHPEPEPATLWQVWAAEPPGGGLVATAVGGGWRLDGTKPFCSGAGLATHALVTADNDGRPALFALDVAAASARGQLNFAPPSWVGAGMGRADTRSAQLNAAPAVPVGGPGDYVDRPGFWHGAIGVAACWAGGTEGVAATLLAAARRRRLDPHALAGLGAVTAAVDRVRSVLERAAAQIDEAGPGAPVQQARRRAESVRASVVAGAEEVLLRVSHALGPAPLALDREHAGRVADLQVFCRQHHGERDLAALGDLAATGGEHW